MPPIVAAVGTLIGGITSAAAGISAFAAGLGGFGSFLLNLGISAGLSLISKAIRPKSKKEAPGGVQASVQFGGDVSRETLFGQQATAGQWVYFNTYGENNKYLQLAYDLSDGACDSLSGITANGKPLSIGGTPEARGIPIPEFEVSGVKKMWVRFYEGSMDQAADELLVANANPPGRWTEDSRGAGQCYAIVEMETDATLYEGGIPQFVFELKGYKCYDIRKDSTAGGSGAHRWGTPSTYEWTPTPAIQLYNYQRGVWLGTELVVGMGLPAYDLRAPLYVAAANICEEAVALKAGGTEARYRCGMICNDEEPHETWISKFLDAMAGTQIDTAGEFGPLAGAAQSPVLEITDADLLSDKPRIYTAKAQRGDRINAVYGNYSEPADQWRPRAFPPRESSDDELADGGEKFPANLDLNQIFSGTQSQRVGEIIRRKGRLTATEDIWVGFEFMRLEPGDWITRTSTTPAFSKTMLVLSVRESKDRKINLLLREISEDCFEWDEEEDELDPQAPVDLPGEGVRQSTVTGFNPIAVEVEGDSGQLLPALKAIWTPILDPTTDAVILQWRIATVDDSGEVNETRHNMPATGEKLIMSGILADTDYEMRATIETTPRRITTWTDWEPVTSTENYVVKKAQSAESVEPGGVNPAALEQGLRDSLRGLQERVSAISEEAMVLAHAVRDMRRGDELAREDARKSLRQQAGFLRAVVEELDLVYITPSLAKAQRIELVEAALEDPDNPGELLAVANVLAVLSASVDSDLTAIASALTALSVDVEDQSVDLDLLLETVIDDTGAYAKAQLRLDVNGRIAGVFLNADADSADFILLADTFQIYNPSTLQLSLYFDSLLSSLVLDNIIVNNAQINGVVNKDGGLAVQSPLIYNKRFADTYLFTAGAATLRISPGSALITYLASSANETFSDEEFYRTTPDYIEHGDVGTNSANRIVRWWNDGSVEFGHYAAGVYSIDTARAFYFSDASWDPLGSLGQTKWICRAVTCQDVSGKDQAAQWIKVPAGMFFVTFKLWGAGGGAATGTGGPGAYVEGKIAVVPGTFIRVIVGEGGKYQTGGRSIGYGGKSLGNNASFLVGGGGGFTAIFFGSQDISDMKACAGAGAGSSGTWAGHPGDDTGAIYNSTPYGSDAQLLSGQMHCGGGGGKRGGGRLTSATSTENSYGRWACYGGESYVDPAATATQRLKTAFGGGNVVPNASDSDYVAEGNNPGKGSTGSAAGKGGLAVLTFSAT